MSDGGMWSRDWGDGLTYIAEPTEDIARASHVLELDGGRFVIEPVDAPGLDDRLGEFGGLDGVIVLMDKHTRDAETVAARHDVPVFAPADFDRIAAKLEGEHAPLGPILDRSPYEGIRVVNRRLWQELALWSSEGRTLVVPETVGTLEFFTVGAETVGLHPTLRLRPPRHALGDLEPERLLVGHGEPVRPLDVDAFRRLLRSGRRRLPQAWIVALRAYVT